MSLTAESMTPADIAACTGNRGNNNGGFGGDGGAWWIILFFIFAWGWGGNGFGGFGGGNGAAQGALTRNDLCSEFSFQDVKREVQNANDAVNLGFANLNSTICNQQYDTARMIDGLGSTIQGGFNATNVAILQGQNAIQAQLAQCCCDQKAATEGLKFTIAQEDCQTRNLIQSTATAMMTNANDNTRAILDKLTQQEMAAKDAQIASQNQKLFAAELAASQAQQNSYLINTLRPTPVPAYPASSPCGYNWSPSVLAGYGYSNGCGCCNG